MKEKLGIGDHIKRTVLRANGDIEVWESKDVNQGKLNLSDSQVLRVAKALAKIINIDKN